MKRPSHPGGKPGRSGKPKLRARRSLSQNFLIDGDAGDRIATALPIRPGDRVYEIGAGKGFLTERLVDTGAEIWAVEKDRRMLGMLRKKFRRVPSVHILGADVLHLPPDAEPPEDCWLVGNLPFGIGQAILAWAMDRRPIWRGAVVTLQREVVRRLIAGPGDASRGAVSIWFQARATGRVLFEIPPRAFHPPPRVTSSVMWIDFTPTTPGIESVVGLDYLLKYAFGHRRKVLANNLRTIPRLAPADWKRVRQEYPELLRMRAQELSAGEFVQLLRALGLDRPAADVPS